jgi:hypothetical protein
LGHPQRVFLLKVTDEAVELIIERLSRKVPGVDMFTLTADEASLLRSHIATSKDSWKVRKKESPRLFHEMILMLLEVQQVSKRKIGFAPKRKGS